ncbi:MAG TPA: rhomboid family intramembrane serine protease [Candidatus Limnocylindria bacterium]|nr:rhomboid family intramembrane serine protease [Candidatus Limnocylindria bacterium]
MDDLADTFRDPALDTAVATKGPLDADVARRLIERGRAKLDVGEQALAIQDFQRVIGHEDPEVTGAALLGLGDALYRLDDEPQARAAWEAITRLRENASTYRAWRNLAGVEVRQGDLNDAIVAYREADRRAPAEDKPEIAARLGWLAKETGNTGAANRYFARSRGAAGLGLAQLLVIATSIVSLVALIEPEGRLFSFLLLDPDGIRNGELYRLLTVALVHAPGGSTQWFSLHLLLNMYALWIVGPIVEQAWGKRLLIGFYVLAAIGASAASFVFSNGPAVGASGAVFGLVGVIIAGTRAHHPQLDRRARALVPQLGFFVILNLAFGFFAGGMIDNAAHVGGLVAGLWLGFLVPPGKVPTLRSAWQHPRGDPGAATDRPPILIAAGIIGLLGVILALLAAGGATL